jgi:lipopolysaccharide transport system ATP-binding protein
MTTAASEPAISVRGLSKCYQLGTIGRHTLVDEVRYWWHKARGRDPREHLGKLGHSATEVRRVAAEKEGAGEFWALRDVTFDVQPGEVIGIIGRNGAGKSTLLKILTRITEPTCGEAFINGRVASLLEVGTGFHPELTGRENVFMNGTILGMKKREIAAKFDEIMAFSELERFVDTPVKRYSSGMYVRLAFSVAAHLEPEILLVDEVLAVGDVAFQKKCLGKMEDVARQGRTVLFVSHNMSAIENLCSKSVLLESGKVSLVAETKRVVDQYMNDAQAVARQVSLRDRVDRQGSGRIRIVDFYITDEQGIRQAALRTGGTYRLNLVCASPAGLQELTDVVASVALTDHRNEYVWLVRSSFMRENVTFRGPLTTIQCTVCDLNVAEGHYHTQLFISHGEHEILDYITNAAEVMIEGGDYFGTGSKGLPSHCKSLTRSHWRSVNAIPE